MAEELQGLIDELSPDYIVAVGGVGTAGLLFRSVVRNSVLGSISGVSQEGAEFGVLESSKCAIAT